MWEGLQVSNYLADSTPNKPITQHDWAEQISGVREACMQWQDELTQSAL